MNYSKVKKNRGKREIGSQKKRYPEICLYVIIGKIRSRTDLLFWSEKYMRGDAKPLLKFLDGSENRFIIPVYQRNYDWGKKQCERLYDDLIQIIKKNRSGHFFGSIVTCSLHGGGKSDYLVIDGQQRITTISLLFSAMVNLLKTGTVKASQVRLCEKIENTYLIDPYQTDERKLRLKPIKDDCNAFDAVVKNDESSFMEGSNITSNYLYFFQRIGKKEISIDELYSAIEHLIIIDIYLDKDDDPQMIFESLNSTGLGLTEADKIRNFVLMGLPSDKQTLFYENYWNRIEKLTDYKVSVFIRDYLTVKTKKIPSIAQVYEIFKSYVLGLVGDVTADGIEGILGNIKHYAEIQHQINSAKPDCKNTVSTILWRLNGIDMNVTYPFLLSILERNLPNLELERSLKCIESFLARRFMCSYASNALNKIFCTLDSEIEKLMSSNPEVSYSDILIYVLESKERSGKFPRDEEFVKAIGQKDIYHMYRKYTEYVFERLENGDTVERVNVIGQMEDESLTVEHIMPQTLSNEWKVALGDNWESIFTQRVHTLPNLTLTGYNSKYSNKNFLEKRDVRHGFRDSGLVLNKYLGSIDKWTTMEMNTRLEWLTNRALNFWPYPETKFIPQVPENDEVSFDEEEDLTGRTILGYSLNGEEHHTKQWVDMFTEVVTKLYEDNPGPIRKLAVDESFPNIVLSNEPKNSAWFKVHQDVYLYKANSTWSKISILQKVFDICEKDKADLRFVMKPLSRDKSE